MASILLHRSVCAVEMTLLYAADCHCIHSFFSFGVHIICSQRDKVVHILKHKRKSLISGHLLLTTRSFLLCRKRYPRGYWPAYISNSQLVIYFCIYSIAKSYREIGVTVLNRDLGIHFLVSTESWIPSGWPDSVTWSLPGFCVPHMIVVKINWGRGRAICADFSSL